VGASYFEAVAMAITGGESETTSVRGSTEEAQFSAS
jgi:isocitrate lyase